MTLEYDNFTFRDMSKMRAYNTTTQNIYEHEMFHDTWIIYCPCYLVGEFTAMPTKSEICREHDTNDICSTIPSEFAFCKTNETLVQWAPSERTMERLCPSIRSSVNFISEIIQWIFIKFSIGAYTEICLTNLILYVINPVQPADYLIKSSNQTS